MNKAFESAQKIISQLLEAPVKGQPRYPDPDIETEDPQVDPDVVPAEPVPEREPDEKPNPFRRREIRPGHEPSPKAALEAKAQEIVNRLLD
jgi:hypothetical protein